MFTNWDCKDDYDEDNDAKFYEIIGLLFYYGEIDFSYRLSLIIFILLYSLLLISFYYSISTKINFLIKYELDEEYEEEAIKGWNV